MTITVKTNLPDFTRQIQELKREMKVIAASSNVHGARVFRKAIRNVIGSGGRAPESRSGRLRAAVVIKRAKRVPSGEVMHIVGIRQGKSAQNVSRIRGGKRASVNLDAFYWRFLEQGFYPRKPGTALRGGRRRKALQRKRAQAAGERKVLRPFLAPAFSRAATGAIEAVEKALDQNFIKATRGK